MAEVNEMIEVWRVAAHLNFILSTNHLQVVGPTAEVVVEAEQRPATVRVETSVVVPHVARDVSGNVWKDVPR